MDHGLKDDMAVLLIEDDTAIADMYKLKLEIDGYQVTVASSGEDGLEQARQLLPDIVFLDIQLPGIGGLEVLERLRKDAGTSNIPVVIVTAGDLQQFRGRALELGVQEFLQKSETTPTRLSRSVSDWVEAAAPANPNT